MNLKAKMYICVNSTIQRCPNKIIKIFLIEDFSHLPPVSTTPVVNLELRISPRIFEKNRNGPNGILWGWGGNWLMKKTRSEKSRDTVPLSAYATRHKKIRKLRRYYIMLLQISCPEKKLSELNSFISKRKIKLCHVTSQLFCNKTFSFLDLFCTKLS